MPTPEEQRIYHAKIETGKDGISVIDDGDVLVTTTGAWHTHIGQPGEVEHSTKFFPPEQVYVPQDMADHLVAGNAAEIVEKKRGRKKAAPENKALESEENK